MHSFNRNFLTSVLAVSVLAAPTLAGAVTFLDTLGLVNTVINAFIPMLITIALVVFFWGLIQFISKSGEAEGQQQARGLMIWGILAIFVMVSVWGIIRLLQSTFKVTSTDPIIPKAIQLQNTGY